MILFETMVINYTQDGIFGCRDGKIVPMRDGPFPDTRAAHTPFAAGGIERYDFNVHVCLVDKNGAQTESYYVTEHSGDTGLLVPEEVLSQEFTTYATPELASLVCALPDRQIALLGISSLAARLHRSFPK